MRTLNWNFDFEKARGSFQSGFHQEREGRSSPPVLDSPGVVPEGGGLW